MEFEARYFLGPYLGPSSVFCRFFGMIACFKLHPRKRFGMRPSISLIQSFWRLCFKFVGFGFWLVDLTLLLGLFELLLGSLETFKKHPFGILVIVGLFGLVWLACVVRLVWLAGLV